MARLGGVQRGCLTASFHVGWSLRSAVFRDAPAGGPHAADNRVLAFAAHRAHSMEKPEITCRRRRKGKDHGQYMALAVAQKWANGRGDRAPT